MRWHVGLLPDGGFIPFRLNDGDVLGAVIGNGEVHS